MRKRFLLTILFYLTTSPTTGLAQEGMGIPSTLPDSTTVKDYITATDQINETNPDSALPRYLLALETSRSIDYDPGTAYCSMQIGNYYLNKQDYLRSQTFLYITIAYQKKLSKPYRWIIAYAYNLLAGAYYYTGKNDSAVWYYNLAMHYTDYIAANRAPQQLLATIYGNMGAMLAASYQHKRGLAYLKKSIHLNDRERTVKSDKRLANNYSNLGTLYSNNQKDIDSARYYWSLAANIYRNQSMTADLQDIYAYMSGVSSNILFSDPQRSALYLDTAINIDPVRAGQNIVLQSAMGSLSYYQGRYDESIRHWELVLKLSINSGSRVHQRNAYEILSYCYAYLGDSLKAHRYQRKFIRLSDSLLNENVTRTIAQIEIQNRISEKDKALAEQNEALAKQEARLYQQRYWLTGSIGGGLILLSALIGLVRTARNKRRLEDERIQNLERQQKIDQLQVERATEERERKRIAQELHDGLGVLLSAAKINQTILARTMPDAAGAKPFNEGQLILSQMQQEVEWITNNLVPDYITENGLENAIQALVAKFNRPGVFDIQLSSYGQTNELHPDRAFSLYRVLEEIIHNAVKHSGAKHLDIQLLYHPEQLHISLEDNGRGFDIQVTYAGMGMQNIENRIMGIGGVFELSSVQGKGTTYILQVPY